MMLAIPNPQVPGSSPGAPAISLAPVFVCRTLLNCAPA